jgi:hypothetical protein
MRESILDAGLRAVLTEGLHKDGAGPAIATA